MNNYILIETADLTQAMRNRSVQPFRIVLVNIGDPAVEYHILEIVRTDLVLTDMFDGYVWYNATEARDIKDSGELPS